MCEAVCYILGPVKRVMVVPEKRDLMTNKLTSQTSKNTIDFKLKQVWLFLNSLDHAGNSQFQRIFTQFW